MARNLMQAGAAFLQNKMETSAGVKIRYVRAGEIDLDEIPAVVGESEVTADNGAGTINIATSVDFTIRSEHFPVGFAPKKNDVIQWRRECGLLEYRVLPADFLPHYSSADGYGIAWRIRTKLITAS
jgi:hypothetical protein